MSEVAQKYVVETDSLGGGVNSFPRGTVVSVGIDYDTKEKTIPRTQLNRFLSMNPPAIRPATSEEAGLTDVKMPPRGSTNETLESQLASKESQLKAALEHNQELERRVAEAEDALAKHKPEKPTPGMQELIVAKDRELHQMKGEVARLTQRLSDTEAELEAVKSLSSVVREPVNAPTHSPASSLPKKAKQ